MAPPQRSPHWQMAPRPATATTRHGAGGELGTSGRENPSVRPQGGGGPAISYDGDHAGVHRERHPAREQIHQRHRERDHQYRFPARRHRPRRTAPGRRLQVGSAGPPAQGGLVFPQPTLSPDDLAALQQAQQREKADLANFDASVDPAEQLNYSNTVTGSLVEQAAQQESLALALLPVPPRRTRSPRRMRASWPRRP